MPVFLYSRMFCFLLLLPCTAVSAQYRAIDRHAAGAPDSLSQNLPALVAYLCGPARSDTEKARSIYSWILKNLTYDETAGERPGRANRSIGDILRRRRGVCFDYSRLFEAMCRLAGLECRAIDGYSRARLKESVNQDTPGHSWNAIRLEGRWQLADPTWGDGGGQDELMARYGADYFLTPPYLFALNHLPAQPMWQLLPCPLDTSWFHQPADALVIDTSGACFAYADSIEAFLQLPESDQRLWAAAAAYRFYPTTVNRELWAQALIDYAVELDKGTEALQQPDSLEALIWLQDTIIGYCEQAAQLAELRDWQAEFFAGLLINQAVAYNQRDNPSGQRSQELDNLQQAREYLLRAQNLLHSLPEDNYYRHYAEKRCSDYLEAVEFNISRQH
ncbi:MAG: hypothetical protein KDC66_02165 [Phaeodactylibacter sp.]|nr:hypothetical protein [Phaeodactylibacter sp.]MCB9273433.1 hypothetical protein [Lewinellaceae bacterium]